MLPSAPSLDPVQTAAAKSPSDAVIIMGGPGTGKTTTMIARVATLLDGGASPETITCLAGTRWLADKMRHQLEGYCDRPDLTQRVFIGTTQQLAVQILRAGGAELVGLPRCFSLWDRARAAQAVTMLVGPDYRTESLRNLPVHALLEMFGHQLGRPTEDVLPRDKFDLPRLLARYRSEKRRQGALDFHDLAPAALEALTKDETFRHAWSDAYCLHILVDDVQDVTPVQYQFVTTTVGPGGSLTIAVNPHLCVPADDGVIGRFLRDYNSAQTFSLPRAYRHTGALVEMTNRVTSNILGHDLGESRPVPVRPVGRAPEVILHTSMPAALGNFLLERVKLLQASGYSLKDIACICPDGDTIGVIKEALDHVGLSYLCLGDPSPGLDRDARRLTHLLEWVLNPVDISAFSVAAFGDAGSRWGQVHSQVAEAILDLARQPGADMIAVVEQQTRQFAPGSVIHEALSRVISARQSLELKLDDPEIRPDQLWRTAMSLFGPDQDDVPFPVGLMSGALGSPFAAEQQTPRDRLRRFLDLLHPQLYPALVTDADGITVCTIPQSTGMEWPVCLVFEPSDDKRRLATDANEDSREHWHRLLYVGATRPSDVLCYVSLVSSSEDVFTPNEIQEGLHRPIGHPPDEAPAGRSPVAESEPAETGRGRSRVIPDARTGSSRGPSSDPAGRFQEEGRSRSVAPARTLGEKDTIHASKPARLGYGRDQRPQAGSPSSPQQPPGGAVTVPPRSRSERQGSAAYTATRVSDRSAGPPKGATNRVVRRKTSALWKPWRVILTLALFVGLAAGLLYRTSVVIPHLKRILEW